MEKEVLRKAAVKQKINETTYKVEDLLSKEELEMKISGKLRMNYFNIPIGENVYLLVSPSNPKSGRFIIEKYINLGNQLNELGRQKLDIDEKIKIHNANLKTNN